MCSVSSGAQQHCYCRNNRNPSTFCFFILSVRGQQEHDNDMIYSVSKRLRLAVARKENCSVQLLFFTKCPVPPYNSTHTSFRLKQLTVWQVICRRPTGRNHFYNERREGGVTQRGWQILYIHRGWGNVMKRHKERNQHSSNYNGERQTDKNDPMLMYCLINPSFWFHGPIIVFFSLFEIFMCFIQITICKLIFRM